MPTDRRNLPPAPQIVGRQPEEYGPELQEFLEAILDSEDDGLGTPHGFTHSAGQGDPLDTPAAPVDTVVNAATALGDGPAYAFEDHSHELDLGLTTKGDLLVRTATGYSRLPVGANTTVLTADSAETSGVKWAAAAASGSVSRRWYMFGAY